MKRPVVMKTSTIEDVLIDAREGRPFIIVNEGASESIGHLVVPAQMATPTIINLMVRHARGLVSLGIPAEDAKRLKLSLMARSETSQRDDFTASIEAREGVTTGISAFDRARTIAVAVDPGSQAKDLVSPGHVFPIIGRTGGVLFNPSHVEAGIDIARIAGLTPAAVLCQCLNNEGEVSSPDELSLLAQEHNIKIASVADLIVYRRRSEKLVERMASAPFSSRYCGDVTIHVYQDTVYNGEHVALVRGTVRAGTTTLVRVHQVDIATDLLGWSAARQGYVQKALLAMQDYDGPAVAVFVDDPSPSSIADRINGLRHEYMMTNATRDYGLGAQILLDLGVRDMVLLTSSARKLAALEGFGLRVVRHQEI